MINTPQVAMGQSLQINFISQAVVPLHQSRYHNLAPSWHEVDRGTIKTCVGINVFITILYDPKR